jgi:hypothetical protein
MRSSLREGLFWGFGRIGAGIKLENEGVVVRLAFDGLKVRLACDGVIVKLNWNGNDSVMLDASKVLLVASSDLNPFLIETIYI